MNTSEEIALEAGLAIAKKIDMDLCLAFFPGPSKFFERFSGDVVLAVFNRMIINRKEHKERYLSHTRLWEWHNTIMNNDEVVSYCRYYGSRNLSRELRWVLINGSD